MEANVYLAVNTKHSLTASPHQKANITVLFQVFYYYIFSQPKKKKVLLYKFIAKLLLNLCVSCMWR